MAGIIKYLAPIDNASGKIFGLKEKFVSVTRQAGNRIRGCAFMGKRNLVNHPLSADEIARHTAFKAMAARVAARIKKTSPRYEADLAAFKKTTFPSLKAYLWDQVKNKLKGIDSVQVGSTVYFPGGKGPELDDSNNLLLNLIPGTLAGLGDFQIKINGTNCPTAAIDGLAQGEVISVSIPASLIGQEMMTVVVNAEGGFYKEEFTL